MNDAERYRALQGIALAHAKRDGWELTVEDVDAEFDRTISHEWEALREVIYKAPDFYPSQVVRKTIGVRGGALVLYEINALHYTIRESIAFPEEWPAAKVAQAEELAGLAFNQVEVWTNEWTT